MSKFKKLKSSGYTLIIDFAKSVLFTLNVCITEPNCEFENLRKDISELDIFLEYKLKTDPLSETSRFFDKFFEKFKEFPHLEKLATSFVDIEYLDKIITNSSNLKEIDIHFFCPDDKYDAFLNDHLTMIQKYDKWKICKLGLRPSDILFDFEMHSSFYEMKMKGFNSWKKLMIPFIYFYENRKRDKIRILKTKIYGKNDKDITKWFSYTKFNETLWIYWILKKQFYLPRELIKIILYDSIWLFIPSKNRKKIVLQKTSIPLSYFKN